MHSTPFFDEVTLARECLERMGEEGGALANASLVLERISHSDGLGEVLRDFARQTYGQLRDLIAAARRASKGLYAADDAEVFERAPIVIKTARQILDMAPTAMARNKAYSIGGEKDKMSRSEVSRAAYLFQQSADVQRLLAADDAGSKLAALTSNSQNALVDHADTADSEATHR